MPAGIKQEKELNSKTVKKIGLSFFMILLVIIIFLLKEILLDKFYPVKIMFNFIADLKQGSDVKFIGGPKIGYVRKIERNNNKVEVTLDIIKSFNLRRKAEISIYTHGMMGERYIEISQTKYSGDYINPDQILTGNDAMSYEIIQHNLARLQKDLKFFNALEKGTPDDLRVIIKRLTDNMNSISFNVTMIRPGLRTNINGYKESTFTFAGNIKQLGEFIFRFRQKLDSFSKDDVKNFFIFFSEFAKEMENLNRSIENLMQATKSLSSSTESVVKEKNTAGKLIYNKEYYNNIIDKMEEFEEFSEKIAKNPSKALFK